MMKPPQKSLNMGNGASQLVARNVSVVIVENKATVFPFTIISYNKHTLSTY